MLLELPLYLDIHYKTKPSKKYYLNLNIYRNTMFRVLAIRKKEYASLVKEIFKDIELSSPPYQFTYTLYPKTKRRIDISNPLSIIDKFTCDALVEMGLLKDDDYKTIPEINYRFGEVDKDNPRCTLRIAAI